MASGGGIPGENFDTLGKQATYSPGGGETPYKPVILNYQQSESTLRTPTAKGPPKPELETNPRKRGPKKYCSKPKVIVAAICLLIILLLIIILPIALTMGSRKSSTTTRPDPLTHTTPDTPPPPPSNETTTTTTTTEPISTEDPDKPQKVSWRPEPPPVANCSNFGFECLENGERVGTNQRCDGKMDCIDGSDELDCKSCATAFQCPSAKKGFLMCLRAEKICDGTRQCPGGEDETVHCTKECDILKNYKCRGQDLCIKLDWMCDGEEHCKDGDDEQGCQQENCNRKSFWCKPSKKCLPIWLMCDGSAACEDGSDEINCNCKGCSGKNVVLCKDPGGVCLSKTQLCDGNPDCPGSEDEINCPGWCELEKRIPHVVCSDKKSYPTRIACSGVYPQCQHRCETCDAEVAFTCASGDCIPRYQVCDGFSNCGDSSDENPELCSCEGADVHECLPERPGDIPKCIKVGQICDGYPDCPRHDDEEDCDSCKEVEGGERPVYCGQERTCHPSTTRCDGDVNCADYSDEDDCSCADCKSRSYPTFMCKTNSRCLKQDFVCNAMSPFHCPGTIPEDEMYCQPNYDPLKPFE